MSGALGLLSSAKFISLLIRPKRKIGTVIPGVVLREHHLDRLRMTRHPVEKSAEITDHAFMEPVEVTIHASWSNSSLQAIGSLFTGGDVLGSLTDGAFGGDTYVQQQYKKILALQKSVQLLTITTGKRKYDNMLIESITHETDVVTEYALPLVIRCMEVIVVSTDDTTLPPVEKQAAPATTASPVNTGVVAPLVVENSDSAVKQIPSILGLDTVATSIKNAATQLFTSIGLTSAPAVGGKIVP